MVGWFGSFVVWLTVLVLLFCGWLVWFFCCMVSLFGSFHDWLIAWLVIGFFWVGGWMDGWMNGCFLGWVAGWLVNWLVCWFVCWLARGPATLVDSVLSVPVHLHSVC